GRARDESARSLEKVASVHEVPCDIAFAGWSRGNYLILSRFCKRLHTGVGRAPSPPAFDFSKSSVAMKRADNAKTLTTTARINVKSGGQECPHHTLPVI